MVVMIVEPIEKFSVSEMVINSLKDLIMNDKLKVGDKFFSETMLCTKLGVSRTSIREAIRVLQAMGYLNVKPGRGAFVARKTEPKKEEIIDWIKENEVRFNDFMDVRSSLEYLAIKLVILNGKDEEIKEIRTIHNNFIDAVEKKNSINLMKYDELFHMAIVNATHNQILKSIYKQLQDMYGQFRSKTFSLEEIYKNALLPHERILLAIESRDVDRGLSAMKEHMEITTEDIMTVTEYPRKLSEIK